MLFRPIQRYWRGKAALEEADDLRGIEVGEAAEEAGRGLLGTVVHGLGPGQVRLESYEAGALAGQPD